MYYSCTGLVMCCEFTSLLQENNIVMIGIPPKRRLQIGLVAKSHIKSGTELFFDYGIKDKDLPLLNSDA